MVEQIFPSPEVKEAWLLVTFCRELPRDLPNNLRLGILRN